MSLRINTNVASMAAQSSLRKNERQLEDSYQALATGQRVSSPRDDAAGFAISERLKGQIAGTGAAERNAENAQALVQTAEGGLNEQNNILVRMRELAVGAASDTVGDEEREFIDAEFQQLTAEFDRIAKSTRFGSRQLLVGTDEEFDFQVGAFKGEENVIKFQLSANTQADEVGIEGLDVNDQDDALDALESLDEAVNKVSSTRAELGAVLSRFDYTIDSLAVQKQNLTEAKAIISDVDVAAEVSRLTSARVLEDAGVMVLAQANQAPANALKLIGNM